MGQNLKESVTPYTKEAAQYSAPATSDHDGPSPLNQAWYDKSYHRSPNSYTPVCAVITVVPSQNCSNPHFTRWQRATSLGSPSSKFIRPDRQFYLFRIVAFSHFSFARSGLDGLKLPCRRVCSEEIVDLCGGMSAKPSRKAFTNMMTDLPSSDRHNLGS